MDRESAAGVSSTPTCFSCHLRRCSKPRVGPAPSIGDPSWSLTTPLRNACWERPTAHCQTELDDMLEAIARDMGRESTYHPTEVGVFFGEPGETSPDPYFDGEGPERTGCNQCGGCMTGCRYNAKNTLDKNYLYLAEKKGVTVVPETEVTDIRPLPGGGYEVDTRRITGFIFKRRKVLRAKGIVMAAGVLGSVPLLFRCKDRGSLPLLSDRLGTFVRTNSEALVGATGANVGGRLLQGHLHRVRISPRRRHAH